MAKLTKKNINILLILILAGLIGCIYYLVNQIQAFDMYTRAIAIFIIALTSYILGRIHSVKINSSSSLNNGENLNLGERE